LLLLAMGDLSARIPWNARVSSARYAMIRHRVQAAGVEPTLQSALSLEIVFKRLRTTQQLKAENLFTPSQVCGHWTHEWQSR
jgi:hypothetical protein